MAKDPYLYPASNVLINKYGIRDGAVLADKEHDRSLGRIIENRNNPIPGSFDQQHFLNIHKHLFKDVYDWAGQKRTIGIEKSESVLGGSTVAYPHPDGAHPANNLQKRLDYSFSELSKDNHLKDLASDLEKYVQRLAYHTSELWECHPFREGNTRATAEFIYQPSENAGIPLNRTFPDEPEKFRDALALGFTGDLSKIEQILTDSIDKSRGIAIAVDNGNRVKEPPATYRVSSMDSANRFIETAIDARVAQITADSERKLEALKHGAEKAHAEFVHHSQLRPKGDLLVSNTRLNDWEAKYIELNTASSAQSTQYSRFKDSLLSNQESVRRQARNDVAKLHPDVVFALKEYRDSERVSTLLEQCSVLQTAIDQAVADGNNPSKLNSLRDKLDTAFVLLENDKTLNQRLAPEQKEKIRQSRVQLQGDISRSRDRGRDR